MRIELSVSTRPPSHFTPALSTQSVSWWTPAATSTRSAVNERPSFRCTVCPPSIAATSTPPSMRTPSSDSHAATLVAASAPSRDCCGRSSCETITTSRPAAGDRARGLAPDEARADHDDRRRGRNGIPELGCVGTRAKEPHVRVVAARHRQRARHTPHRQHARVVGEGPPVIGADLLAVRVQPDHPGAELHLDLLVAVELLVLQRQLVLVALAAEVVLRQRRTLVRRMLVGAQQAHSAPAVVGAIAPRRLEGRRPAPDDEQPGVQGRSGVRRHAGDGVDVSLLDELEARARRLIGVYGNNDHGALRERLPEVARVEIEGLHLGVVHETGATKGREARCAAQFPDLDVLVFGHSHIPWDTTAPSGLRLLNPGSPTDRRRQPTCTYMTAAVSDGALQDVILHDI